MDLPTRDEILSLSVSDATVHACLTYQAVAGLGDVDTLRLMVRHLAREKRSAIDLLSNNVSCWPPRVIFTNMDVLYANRKVPCPS